MPINIAVAMRRAFLMGMTAVVAARRRPGIVPPLLDHLGQRRLLGVGMRSRARAQSSCFGCFIGWAAVGMSRAHCRNQRLVHIGIVQEHPAGRRQAQEHSQGSEKLSKLIHVLVSCLY